MYINTHRFSQILRSFVVVYTHFFLFFLKFFFWIKNTNKRFTCQLHTHVLFFLGERFVFKEKCGCIREVANRLYRSAGINFFWGYNFFHYKILYSTASGAWRHGSGSALTCIKSGTSASKTIRVCVFLIKNQHVLAKSGMCMPLFMQTVGFFIFQKKYIRFSTKDERDLKTKLKKP